jgi:hypothetical protein
MNVNKVPNADLPLQKRLLSITEATVYLGIGRSSALKYLEEIGAKRKIGRRTLYDKTIIDENLSKPPNGEVNLNG